MKFRGLKATVVIELEGRYGTIRVPIHDMVSYTEHSPGLGELRIPIGSPLMERLYLGDRESKLKLGG